MKYKFINIKVKCPRDLCSVYPMQIKLVDPDGIGFFAMKVNGCDYHNSSDCCRKCCAAIDKRFEEDLYYVPLDIISPDFSKLK